MPKRVERETRVCEREECDQEYEVLVTSPRRFCGRACGSKATAEVRAASHRALGRHQAPICPCGKEVPPPPGMKYAYEHSKKYCSPECRLQYGKKRQRDPSKWRTLVCQNETCGKTYEIRTSARVYGKYCSNACAQRHTKTKKHIVVDNAVVLDSGWEALVWGLCAFAKIPIERVDREHGVAWGEGRWYAPDFYLPTMDTYVEVKGLEDDEDPVKWETWRSMHTERLLVLGRWEIEQWLGAGSHEVWLRGSG